MRGARRIGSYHGGTVNRSKTIICDTQREVGFLPAVDLRFTPQKRPCRSNLGGAFFVPNARRVQLLLGCSLLTIPTYWLCALMGARRGKGFAEMQDRMELAARYRDRAATVRKIAEMVLDNVEYEQLLVIARDYECLVRDVEAKAIARGALLSLVPLQDHLPEA